MADRFEIPQQAIVRSTRAGGVETLGREGIFLCDVCAGAVSNASERVDERSRG